MEKASAPLYLVVTLLVFYLLIPANAVPLSRVQRTSLQEAGEMPSVEGSTPKPKMDMERFVPVEDDAMINARMALEMQDYSPPGPNHHHTPPGRH